MGELSHATPSERLAIREEIVLLHLSLAVSAAHRYRQAGEVDDLVQVALTGLVEAFDRFDPEQGSYSNFAWLTMTGLLRRHLRDLGWSVRPPRSLQESANTLRKALPALTQDLGRTPSTEDFAQHVGWTPAEVRDAHLANQGLRATSIESLVSDDWVPAHPPEWDQVENRLLLERALGTLTDDERHLLQLRFLDELSQAEIGAVLGTNQMQVSRRLAKLMLKLRTEIGDRDDVYQHPSDQN